MTGLTYTLTEPGDGNYGNGFQIDAENEDEDDDLSENPSSSEIQDLKLEDPQTDEIIDDDSSDWKDEGSEEEQGAESPIREKQTL